MVAQEGVRESLRAHRVHVLAGTWNVNTSKAQPQSIFEWLGKRAGAADLVCIGLQVRRGLGLG